MTYTTTSDSTNEVFWEEWPQPLIDLNGQTRLVAQEGQTPT
jgi:hypothetical protein